MPKRTLVSNAILTAGLLLGLSPAGLLAATSGDGVAGVELYQKGDYKGAVAKFEAAIGKGKADADDYYYAALCHQTLGDFAKAASLYQLIIKNYPDSQAARLAQVAAEQLKDRIPPDDTAGDTLPRETWINYTKYDSRMLIDADVNHHPMKMLFDTGAEGTVFGINQLQRLDLQMPQGKPNGFGAGVGGKQVAFWIVPVTLKVGKIERRNFPIAVTAVPQQSPLLGQDFYRGYQYEIDDTGNVVTFKKNAVPNASDASATAAAMTVTPSGKYVYNLPYTLWGKEMIVDVTVNGRTCKMAFDTGASTCFFTYDQIKKLGITMRSRRSGSIAGVAGVTSGELFSIDSLKVGALEKENVWAAVTDAAVVNIPLLGQTFFGDYNYTIDTTHHVIQFTKK